MRNVHILAYFSNLSLSFSTSVVPETDGRLLPMPEALIKVGKQAARPTYSTDFRRLHRFCLLTLFNQAVDSRRQDVHLKRLC